MQLAYGERIGGNHKDKHKSDVQHRVEMLLTATGLPWRIVPGSKHLCVWLNGEKIGAISNGRTPGRDEKQIAAKIRQYLRTHCQSEFA